MDMKRILQAIDGVTTKPVVGADSMAKFLRVVKEAEINQPAPVAPTAPTAPVAPAAPTAPAQPASTLSPEQLAYNQLRAQLDSVDSIRGDANANTFTDISPEVVAGEARMRTKLAQMAAALQAKGIDAAAEYDAPDPAVPASAPVDLAKKYVDENISMSKLLSVIQKNDVKILNEGKGPHKVTLPVQMTMQHYQQAESSTTYSTEPSLLKKYFHEVESEVNEQAQAKRQRVNQYASVIAERVLMKGSKNKILNEGDLEVLRPSSGSVDYNSVRFRIDGEPVEPNSEEFDYYYKLVFKKDPPNKFVDTLKGMMSEPHDSMGVDLHKDSENDVQDGDVIIPSHPKGEWVKVRDIVEMAAHLRNDPDGHTIIPHGGMGSGKEETWKSVSTKKLQQVIDMINSGNYSGAEHVLYKNGFLQGAVQALARYEEFKAKQGKRRMKAGREVEIGEQGTTTDPQLKSKFEELLSKF